MVVLESLDEARGHHGDPGDGVLRPRGSDPGRGDRLAHPVRVGVGGDDADGTLLPNGAPDAPATTRAASPS